MVEQAQLSINTEGGTARTRPGPLESGIPVSPSDTLPIQNIEAHDVPIKNIGTGEEELANAAIDVTEQQIKAQQTTALMQKGSDYELKGQQLLQNTMRNAQPGQTISDSVADGLTKLQQTTGDAFKDNPIMQNEFNTRAIMAQRELISKASAYDFQERDRNAEFNFKQGILSQQNILSGTSNYDDIAGKHADLMGEALKTIEDAPVSGITKQKWQQDANVALGEAANRQMIQLDYKRWLTEHAYNLTPESRQADDMPRGIRNNNPGNLTGDDAWQGKVGKDEAGYIKFDNPEDGLRALNVNLVNQQDKHGLNTVDGIISKFAPPDTNDTASYVADVSQKLGVKPDDTIDLHDPVTLHKMSDAIVRHENGAQPLGLPTTAWAAETAAGEHTNAAPDQNMPHGGVRTDNAAFNMLPYDKQQELITHAFSVRKEEMTLGMQVSAQARTQLQEVQTDMAKGVMPSKDMMKSLGQTIQQSGNPALQQQFEKIAYKSDFISKANGTSTPDLESMQNELDKMPPTPARDDKLALLNDYLKNRSTAVNKDPLGYWHNQGNELPPLDLTKPQSLQQRSQIAYQVANQYDINPADAFLRDDDRTYLNNVLTSATAQQKLATLNALHSNLSPELYNGAISSLRDNNSTIAAAGDYLALSKNLTTPHWIGKDQTTSSSDIANALVQGDSLLRPADKSKPFPVPSDGEIRAVIPAQYQQVFRNMPKAEQAAFEAAKSYYAYSASQTGDYSGGSDKSKVQNGVADAYAKVLGTTSKFNGAYVLAPWGMDETGFRNSLQGAYGDQAAKAGIDTKTFPFSSVGFQNTGEMGKYLATSGNGYMVDKKGRPVVIDLTNPPEPKK